MQRPPSWQRMSRGTWVSPRASSRRWGPNWGATCRCSSPTAQPYAEAGGKSSNRSGVCRCSISSSSAHRRAWRRRRSTAPAAQPPSRGALGRSSMRWPEATWRPAGRLLFNRLGARRGVPLAVDRPAPGGPGGDRLPGASDERKRNVLLRALPSRTPCTAVCATFTCQRNRDWPWQSKEGSRSRLPQEVPKGESRYPLPERPGGCFAQRVPVPFRPPEA